MEGEHKTHARIGTALLVLMTWGGLAVSWGTQYQKTENLAVDQANIKIAASESKSELLMDIKSLRSEIGSVRDKAELPARLEERMAAMQRQLDRIESKVKRW